MNNLRSLDRRCRLITWGALFILFGILMIVPGDQGNLYLVLSGVLLLGLNLARSLRRIPVSPFSITLGCLTFGLGGLGLAWPLMHLPRFEIGLLPLALVAFGLYLLLPGAKPADTGKVE